MSFSAGEATYVITVNDLVLRFFGYKLILAIRHSWSEKYTNSDYIQFSLQLNIFFLSFG